MSYLTNPDRRAFLSRCTVEQANNQFHVIEIVSQLERIERDELLSYELEKESLEE